MSATAPRVPLHLVCAESFEAAQACAAALAAGRADWRVLAPRACLCCVGRVALQVELVRLLRWHQPARVLLVLASEAHLETTRRRLDAAPLSDAVVRGRTIVLPRDAALKPTDLEVAAGPGPD